MATDVDRRLGPARPTHMSNVAVAAALVAALLSAIPLVLARLDGDADLDPFFAALVAAALVIALAATRPRGSPARMAAMLLAVVWIGAAVSAAFLLVMYQSACACSTPDPSGFPRLPTYAGLPATAFHLLATYGGGLLVAIAAFRVSPTTLPDDPAWNDVTQSDATR